MTRYPPNLRTIKNDNESTMTLTWMILNMTLILTHNMTLLLTHNMTQYMTHKMTQHMTLNIIKEIHIDSKHDLLFHHKCMKLNHNLPKYSWHPYTSPTIIPPLRLSRILWTKRNERNVFRLTKRAFSYAGLSPPLSWWANDIHNEGSKEIHPREFVIKK